MLKRLKDIVDQSHKAGLFFFTFGDANNAVEHYSAQRAAGVDAIILDDTARLAKVRASRVRGQEISMACAEHPNVSFWENSMP